MPYPYSWPQGPAWEPQAPHRSVKIGRKWHRQVAQSKVGEANKEIRNTMEPIVYTKRVGHLFEKVTDLENIKTAIKNASKRKTNRSSVQRVLADIDDHALKIQRMLLEETFVPKPYTIREINDGIKRKKRIIAVPRFYPDQCIHHAFVQVFKEIVMHSAYEYSCGCVPGKGTDGAKKAIEKWIRKDPAGTSKVLKLDVKKCYPSMSHEVLRQKLRKRIKDRRFLRLADILICSFQQPMATGERMLPEADAVGIPVGLYTSPWFCNFFFQDIDHLIRRKCGVRHSTRYVDDMVLFDTSKKRLHQALRIIAKELEKVKMRVKENWQVFHLRIRPLDFLGFKFHKGYTTIRKSIMLRISRKARTIARKPYISITNASGMVSYMGYVQNSDSRQFYEKHVQPFVNIKNLKGVISNENRKHNQTICEV